MFQRSELALRLKPKLEAEAKERMVAEEAKGNQGTRTDLHNDFSDKFPKSEKKAKENLITSTGGSIPQPLAETPKAEKVDTRKETAKLANTSSHKVREVDTVLKHGTPEQVKRMEEARKN